MIKSELLYEKVMLRLDMTRETGEEELQEIILAVIEEAAEEEFLPLSEKIRISRELFNAFRRLDILQDLIEDDSITEIMVNGTENIFYEKGGRLYRTDRHFISEERLCDVIQQIVGETNRYVNESSPVVDARLRDGSRVNVVLKPVAVNGPIMTIRKFPSEAITMEQLIRMGSLTREAAEFIRQLVEAKYNIFVSGGTGAGKTTFLNAMSDYIPKEERIITIEDNAELQIQGVDNLVRLEARGANLEGEGAVTIRDLIRSALRMRPDRIIVGEVRGEETVDMISSAMLNGHSGSMSTGHANNPADMLHRLETMMMMGIDLPLQAIQRQIASALDIIIHLGRLRDKSRRVLKIEEVLDCMDGRIRTETLYEFREEGMKDEKIEGSLVKAGEIKNREKLVAAGYKEV
ncbi:CpaF family protein [Mediterraneibacter glycyrrhizinilyticus]|uniref:CpaF family protein n=1 Tax=Candidatus Mediterraneibacter faecipullorum TaxID=2838670 RepID=A0A9D2NPB5_9FIRM|nr:CpaF family protein [Mediterraneibacter glycyrrhizinilyticus]MBM6803269.1 CpaF family protein [Mediterraneibacter glycyrrhizinilyticus]HJC35036.1 CpaF family protein [Candidatus Mediterraneibacter faecipullorum]